jgi:hypothetical protein
MIPYLLGIAGGYLIGSARELFAKGGGVDNQDTDIPTIEITKVEPDERGRKTSKVKYNVNYQITIDENLMEIEGILIPYDSGRDEEHRFEPGYFMDSETEEYFYDNFEKIETEILNKFSTYLGNYAKGGGIEMLQELWYVTDNEGKVKNISTSKEKAELFLADKLKYSGNINYVKVPLSEWMGEKVNVGNIKQYAKSLWQNYAKGGNIGEYTFYVKDKQGKVIFKSKRLNKTSDYIVTNNLKDVSVIAIDKNGNEKVLQGGNQLN